MQRTARKQKRNTRRPHLERVLDAKIGAMFAPTPVNDPTFDLDAWAKSQRGMA